MNLGYFQRPRKSYTGRIFISLDMAGITVHSQDQVVKVLLIILFILGFAGMFYFGSELIK